MAVKSNHRTSKVTDTRRYTIIDLYNFSRGTALQNDAVTAYNELNKTEREVTIMAETMIYPNYLVRRPDDGTVLACTKTLDDAKEIKARFDKEDADYTLKEFGEAWGIEFEIYDVLAAKVVVRGYC